MAEREDWIDSAVARYERPLVRYAVRWTGDLERARDLVQETFLKLCAADRGRVEGHLAEWLFTVCRNLAVDQSRRRREGPMGDAMDRVESTEDPTAPVARQEQAGRVVEILARLPANQQEVLRLKFQEGFTYQRISRVTGHTVDYVGVLIHEGLKTLRRQVAVGQTGAGA